MDQTWLDEVNKSYLAKRCVYLAVHTAGCKLILEKTLDTWCDDLIWEVAREYVNGGGSINELEFGESDKYIQWDHPYYTDHYQFIETAKAKDRRV